MLNLSCSPILFVKFCNKLFKSTATEPRKPGGRHGMVYGHVHQPVPVVMSTTVAIVTTVTLQPGIKVLWYQLMSIVVMPPTSEKLRGHIGLGPSVCLSVTHWQLRNSRTAYARILKLYMWHVHEK